MSKRKKPNLPKGMKQFKFKIYWVYIAIFIFFVGIQFIGTDITQATNWQDFNNRMLQNQEVNKIVVVNKEKAYIYIKEEFLSRSEHEKVYKKPFGNGKNPGPHYYFEIGSVESFENKLQLAQNEFEKEDIISPYYETRKDVL